MKDKIIILLATLTCVIAITYMSNNNKEINSLNAYAEDKGIIISNQKILQREVIPSQDEPWYIETDLYNQIVTVYAKDKSGEYTNVVKQFPCSGGGKAYNTESKTPYMFMKTYNIEKKRDTLYKRYWYRSGWVDYLTHVWGQFFFHSVLYTDDTMSGFEHNSYNDITFPASHGCVRLISEDAKWIFTNAKNSTRCDFTKNESNPELSQMYQPMPPKDEIIVATRPPDYGVRVTQAPDIEWDELNRYPKNYVPGDFVG